MTNVVLLLIAGYGLWWAFFRRRPDCRFDDLSRDFSHDMKKVSKKAAGLPSKGFTSLFKESKHPKAYPKLATLVFWLVVGLIAFQWVMNLLAAWT